MTTLPRVHTGAIIALQRLPTGHFVSGGADGRIRYWSGGGHPEVLEEMAFVIHRCVANVLLMCC